MNMFEQYGIKEVADVTIYSIHKKEDGSGEVYYVPALYLDTLKITTTEKTAENVWAQGGLGNSRLICWDYGKEINLTLQDALCTPASLGLCWGGVLGADWKDGKIKQDFGINFNNNPVEKISRMEKVFYPRNNIEKDTISYLLPQLDDELRQTKEDKIIKRSSIIDGTKVEGYGYTKNNRPYKWKMNVESDIKSIAVVPDRFYDIYGNSYPINQAAAIGVRVPSQTDEFKFEIIYKINVVTSSTPQTPVGDSIIIDTQSWAPSTENTNNENNETNIENTQNDDETGDEIVGNNEPESINDAKWLKISIDKNNKYHAYIGEVGNPIDELGNVDFNVYTNYNLYERNDIDLSLFEGIDMWNRFDNINEMIYFLLTKYEDNVIKISSGDVRRTNPMYGELIGTTFTVEPTETSIETYHKKGKLWCYINPRTMTPYPDDYWFHLGEPYYIKSLTLMPDDRQLKAKRIQVTAGQFPGMYMIVGETYIRNRDTGIDERMQLKFPLCKILSTQTLTLEAEGEPTVFDLNVEVARPINGIMMEITSYDVAQKMIEGTNGVMEIKDGSTEVLTE